jgi:ABC-type amino acid transport substrate-binding protein
MFRMMMVFILGLSAPSILGKNSERALRVGLIEYHPLIGFDGIGPDGPLFEYAQTFLAQVGMPLNFQQVSIDRSIEQLKSGHLDLVLTLFKTPERERHIRYGRIPLLSVNAGFCTREDIDKHPLTHSTRLAHIRGTIVPQELKILDLHPVTGDNMQVRLLQMLKKGRVDAIFSPKPEIFLLTAYLANMEPPKYCYELRGSRVPIFLGFSKELPMETVRKIEASLEIRVQEEEFDHYLKRRLNDFGMKSPTVQLIDPPRLPSKSKP